MPDWNWPAKHTPPLGWTLTRPWPGSPTSASPSIAGTGDDVQGFENTGSALGGGLAVTGNYPGRARTPEELRSDLDRALSLIPGTHCLNLHACYGEFGGKKVDRDAVEPAHFEGWIDWARQRGMGMDFNPTYFVHPKAADGFTLAHPDAGIRNFWIEHGKACRRIGAAMGRALGKTCVTNVWIPDGFKNTPADRLAPRERLTASLDALFAESLDPAHNLDAVEAKLFGIGSESYVVGSHEFYLDSVKSIMLHATVVWFATASFWMEHKVK